MLSACSVLLAACVCVTAGTASDTVHARLTATIGDDAPSTPFLLGEVSGLAVDDAGRVYVSDFQDPRIVVFAPDGRHLATIGRKGKGPGEFIAPTGPVIAPDGSLWVRNMSEFAHFVVDAKTRLPTKFDRAVTGPALAPWRSKRPSFLDRANRFYFPRSFGGADGLVHNRYLRYTLDGNLLDSLTVPLFSTTRAGWASIMVSARGGRMIPGLNIVPFHPLPVWAVTPAGALISGPADKYELNEAGPDGRTIRTIVRAVRAIPIPPAVRAESLRALKRRIDTLPVPIASVHGVSDEVRALRLPDNFPFYRGLSVDPGNGDLWVWRWTSDSGPAQSVVDVFSSAGRYVRTVVLPANCATEPSPVVRRKTIACLQLDPESGAEFVVIAQLGR